ncbi:hypothetical protein D3C71_934350 [compost metagenome]
MHLVASMVYAIVVDVEHIVAFQQFAAAIPIQLHKVFGGNGFTTAIQCSLQDLGAINRTLGALPIHQHGAGFVVDNRQCLVGQKRRHAKLGVAGQHR